MIEANGHTPSTNGHARHSPAPTPAPSTADARTLLRETRTRNRLLVEQLRSRRLEALEKVSERRALLESTVMFDWVTPYAELLDRMRSDPVTGGPAAYWNRRYGRNYPIFQTETELSILRAPARILCATNNYAIGLLSGIQCYVNGNGFTYRVTNRQKELSNDDKEALQPLQHAAQEIIDEFLARTQWHGGEMPGIEDELLWRESEDGESILLHYCLDDGRTDVRIAEPEQLTAPPMPPDWSATQEAGWPYNWMFGICTDKNDSQQPLAYWLFWGDTAASGEEYTPDEVVHVRNNVKRSIKRGLTDFCFDTLDSLQLAGRLRTNLADGAAQQAAIVGVMQHSAGTEADVSAWLDEDADYQAKNPANGKVENVRRVRTGFEHIPKGQEYVAPPNATNAPAHVSILQQCLNGAGVRWNAPPWLISGDGNTMNYAMSLTAESPFVRKTVSKQRTISEARKRTMWTVLRNHCDHHGGITARTGNGRTYTWEQVRRLLEIEATATTPETRNKLSEAQQAAIEIPLGTDSRQRFAQSQGRDWNQVQADNEQYAAETGGMGGMLPMPGQGGAGQGGGSPFGGGPGGGIQTKPRQALGESIFESVWRDLFEDHGSPPFPGAVFDDASHRWKRGGAGDQGAIDGPRSNIAAESQVDTFKGITDELGDEAKQPGVLAKIKGAFAKIWDAAHIFAMQLGHKIQMAAPEVLDVAADYSKIYYAGRANSGMGGTTSPDPFMAHLGIGCNTVAVVASHVLGRASVWVRGKLKGRKESEDGIGEMGEGELIGSIVAVLNDLNKALGVDDAVDSADVAAWLDSCCESDVLEAGRAGLVKTVITDKNGVKRTVYTRPQDAQAAKRKAGAKDEPLTERPTVEGTIANVAKLRESFSTEGLVSLAQSLHHHTVKELGEIKQQLGIKASGKKAELARKIAERALQAASAGKSEKLTAKAAPEKPVAKKEPAQQSSGKPNADVSGLYDRASMASKEELDALPATLAKMSREDLSATWQAMGLKTPAAWGKAKLAHEIELAIVHRRGATQRSGMTIPQRIKDKNAASSGEKSPGTKIKQALEKARSAELKPADYEPILDEMSKLSTDDLSDAMEEADIRLLAKDRKSKPAMLAILKQYLTAGERVRQQTEH